MTAPITRTSSPGLLCLASLLATLFAGPASAQSTAELREENQTLRTELADMTAELSAARAEIERLRALVSDLMKQLDSAATGGGAGSARAPMPPLEPEKVSVDESVPHASPRAALGALKKAYEAEFGTVELGTADSRERRLFARRLERWGSAQERLLRLPIEWHVRMQSDPQYSGREVMVLVQAVDPETDVLLGGPFRAFLPRGSASRILRRVHGEEVVVLKGTMHPRVMYNETRLQRGAFDSPPFIGPFAEFAITADVQSLSSPAPDETVAGAEGG